MHIPGSMLQNTLCTVTLAAAAASLVAAVHFARKAKDRPTSLGFGALTALIFAAQMMNFPVMNGVSGHLLGGVLAAALLGIPFGVLSVALVISVQALLLGDGGLDALGANIFNMAVLGAGVGGVLYQALHARCSKPLAMAIASWGAVMLAALAVSLELGGTVAFLAVAPSMLGVHALVGIGEALIAVLTFELLSSTAVTGGRHASGWVSSGLAAMLVLFSPFASALPDGLAWVVAQQGLAPAQAIAPLIHMGIPLEMTSMVGALVSFAAGWGMLRIMNRPLGKRMGS
ncbi:MAG TPA: energy-coupling factor ABC transporter permease [Gallionella sp.]|nr:energy-coupling factor ABC transporter permease [Gallionella sp.]